MLAGGALRVSLFALRLLALGSTSNSERTATRNASIENGFFRGGRLQARGLFASSPI
jgi:hypothetical protein